MFPRQVPAAVVFVQARQSHSPQVRRRCVEELGELRRRTNKHGQRQHGAHSHIQPKEHAEARLPSTSGAIVIGAADADFRSNLSFDVLGRRSITSRELARGEGQGEA